MDYEFHSLQELYKRVEPALSAKISELKRLGYYYIKEVDIWNYLIEDKWKKGNGLMLSDIVDDILNTDCSKIDTYLKNKVGNSNRLQYFDESIEVIWGERNGKK